ncbi:MAG: hypothetical protein FWG03_09185 [Clostridiales bacterium]|nr:hypothetical protein [Clostridiales bacterium]
MNRLGTEYADRLNAVKTDRGALFSAIVCALLLILILYSFYVRVRMYMLGISLWVDEAMLAENIAGRSMAEMLTPPLSGTQTAPVLYLIAVKALTILFGASEAVLRSYSFIALAGMLVAQGVLLRKVFRLRMVFTLFSVAVSSTFLYYMQYSAELKPYMGDAAFALCVLLGYYAYRKGLLGRGIRGAVMLALILSACMLFSSPAAFAAGAVFIVEFILKCARRDRAAILLTVISGAVFIAAFALNYFFWLRPIATDTAMVDFWYHYRFEFDFIKYRTAALAHDFTLIKGLLGPVQHMVWLMLPLSVAGVAISLARRCVYTVCTGVFFLLLLSASSFDKYPVADRLWMFLYVIIFIYAFVFIDSLRISLSGDAAGKVAQAAIPLFLSALLLVPNLSFPAYGRGEEWTYGVDGRGSNPLIAYVSDNIRDGEYLYSFVYANTILRYKNGYGADRIGDTQASNIIYGTEDVEADIERITGTGGAYVYFFMGEEYDEVLTGPLQERGCLDLVKEINHTYLYWYTDDVAKAKASAALELQGLETGEGWFSGTVRIVNTGQTVLSPEKAIGRQRQGEAYGIEGYGQVYIVLQKAGAGSQAAGPQAAGFPEETILGVVGSPLMPGESVDIHVGQDGLEPGEYLIGLIAWGEYDFTELGLAPARVTV